MDSSWGSLADQMEPQKLAASETIASGSEEGGFREGGPQGVEADPPLLLKESNSTSPRILQERRHLADCRCHPRDARSFP